MTPTLTERERIEKIIETLEYICSRPGMFAGDLTVAAVGAYLSGFEEACAIVGPKQSRGARYRAETERGWKSGAEVWAMSQLRARGMTEPEMVDEMFAIDIAAWRITAKATDDGEEDDEPVEWDESSARP